MQLSWESSIVLKVFKCMNRPWFVKIYSKHCQSQTGRARELKFWENVHPTLCVMCYVSCVRCQVSGVRCQVSGVRCQVSGVMCQIYIFFGGTKWLGWLVEGLLSTGPTPSSLFTIIAVTNLLPISSCNFFSPQNKSKLEKKTKWIKWRTPFWEN